MFKIKAICVFSVLVVAAGSASAGGGSYVSNVVSTHQSHAGSSHQGNDRGAYAGFGYGNSDMSIDGIGESFKDKNTRAYLGYDLNRFFAVEGGYSSIPLDGYIHDVGDITGIDVSVLAKLPVTSRMAAFARVGYWDWDYDGAMQGKKHDNGGTDLLYGVGLEYKVSPKFKIRLDSTRFEANDAHIDTLNGSIAYSW